MRIRVASELPVSADVVRDLLRKPVLLQHVAWPVLMMPAMPREFSLGEEATIRLYLLGVIPLWRHTIRVVDVAEHEARTEEYGGPLRTWCHRVVVTPVSDTRCRYTDEVEIDAGRLTVAAATFARLFYRYRHRRWLALARVLG